MIIKSEDSIDYPFLISNLQNVNHLKLIWNAFSGPCTTAMEMRIIVDKIHFPEFPSVLSDLSSEIICFLCIIYNLLGVVFYHCHLPNKIKFLS